MKKIKCDPADVAIKSFFLGPQAENADWVLNGVTAIFQRWFEWRKALFPNDGKAISSEDLLLKEFQSTRDNSQKHIEDLLTRFEKEIPKFSPRYIGHMFSEISLPALFGHVITLLHNPNNISSESSKVGIQIEDEAILCLAKMVGMSLCVGHFTSGGTVANFECLMRAIERVNKWAFVGVQGAGRNKPFKSLFEAAHMGWDKFGSEVANNDLQQRFQEEGLRWTNPLMRARKISDAFGIGDYEGPVLLVPTHKHYSWTKGASLFGLGEESIWSIELNEKGTLHVESLRVAIEKAKKLNRPIVAVVSVLGTTELGFVDPIEDVQSLLEQYQKQEGLHIWHHVDAAFGGFFPTVKSMEKLRSAIARVNSLTIDPHKMGYVPYSCGAFMVGQSPDYYVKSFVAPYVQFNVQKDKGPFTLEGSRSAAGAVATWLTAQSIGFTESGYGAILERTLKCKSELEISLRQSSTQIHIAPSTDLNILGFCVANVGDTFEQVNQKTLALYDAIERDPSPKFFVSKTQLYKKSYFHYLKKYSSSWNFSGEIGDLDVIRICIMNPFFDSKELNTDLKQDFAQYVASEISKINSQNPP